MPDVAAKATDALSGSETWCVIVETKFLVALLGSRMSYAVPRILHRAGSLERLYTDLCAAKGWQRWLRMVPAACRPEGLRRLLGRVPSGIPPQQIEAFQHLGWQYARRRRADRSPSETTSTYLWANQAFCRAVCRSDWGAATGVFTFNGAGLEILAEGRRRGLRTVTEQTIAPRALEEQLLREEREAFPGWEAPVDDSYLQEYCEREESEWPLADLIVCGSEFVRQGIIARGGPAERCAVVPYGVDHVAQPQVRQPHPGRLRVLTVGAVGLRKGLPYIQQAARRLHSCAEFRVVGPLGVSSGAEQALRSELDLVGSVPREELSEQYQWADVFLLPSICEGSATVVYDALAYGLPVITTPNTGTVVRDGIDGFLVPIRSAESIADCLERLVADRTQLAAMSSHAAERARSFTVAGYGSRLLQALSADCPEMSTCDALE